MSVESSPTPAPSIWHELERWSQSFANWQKLLLAGAVRNGAVPEALIDQAYALFLAEYDLAAPPTPPPEIPSSMTGRDRLGADRRRLKRVYAPSGVNQLPASAEISFASGLTVIYGGNGVGKSGFARILSNACFSRQQHPIYPDVFDDTAASAPSAMIDVVDDEGNVAPLRFGSGAEHGELRRGFVVFDSAVANRHLTETGPLGFTPTGFDVFAEMARGYASLQSKLAADVQLRRRENALANAFIGPQTPASLAATSLGPATDIEALRVLAAFGPDQTARIEQLQAQADQLRTQSPEQEIRRLSTARPQVLLLKQQLESARTALSEDMLDSDVRLRNALIAAANEVARLSADQFRHDGIRGIGSPVWVKMIATSQELALQQHEHYPGEGDVCLICQQPLGADAQALYARYAAFVSDESRAILAAVQQKIDARKTALERLSQSLAAEGSVAHGFLKQSHPAILRAIEEGVAITRQLQASALAAFTESTGVTTSAIPDFTSTLDGVTETIDSDLLRLQQSDVPSTLAKIEKERIELRHREVLSQNLDAAIAYVHDRKWIVRAEGDARAALNPRHLTEKQRDLFASVIAKEYRNGLITECEALACTMPIELRTQGRQGQTVRSLRVGDRSPDDILSEGEQRAVALADFLTEIGLNEDNVGIVLDDPVTSLDHDRKDRIAARLVAAASERQVIIFTHDMVFFAKLADAADKAGADMLTHWMQRSSDGKRPGAVSANDAPTTTPQYRKTDFAEETLAKAKAAAGSAQEALVRQGAGQLRRTVEEIVPQFLFKEVVRRWTDRVMVTALKKISWDNALADEIVEIFEACSAMMEGHSHTEAGAEAPPTPAKLEELIVRTKDLIRRAKVNRG